jgi:TonB-dependent starch-binding outer membrane protein SusC
MTHTAFTPSTLENKDLRWEKTSQFDIGFDLGFIEDRILFTADYYYKKTSDILLEVPQPTSTGFSTALENAGSLENKGFEFQLSSRNIVSSDFRWNTDFNISFNRNKVISIVGNTIHSGGINPAGDAFNTAVVQEGQPLGSFWGKISEGVDPATGMIKFMQTADGSADSVGIIGNANPDFIWGFTNSFALGNFTIDLFLQGVQGNQIMNATRILTESMALSMNQSATVLNRWHAPGDITDMPGVTPSDWTNSNPSTRYLENGSYLRVKSLTLGYTFDQEALRKVLISRIMLYMTAENLLTFTKYSGFDPEVSTFSSNGNDATNQNTALGVDYGTYPQSRDFVLGLKISF